MQAFAADIAKAVAFVLVVVGLTRLLELGVRRRAEAEGPSEDDGE